MNFLVIDGDKPIRDAACLLLEGKGHYTQPAESGDAGLTLLKESKFDAVLLDIKPGQAEGLGVLREIRKRHVHVPVVTLTTQGTLDMAVEAMRLGAVDFLEKPFTPLQLHAAVTRLQLSNRMNQAVAPLERDIKKIQTNNPELLLDFASPAMHSVMDVLARAAKSSATVLLSGESGTGKSVLARMIHNQSHLASKPFVTVSCPSLSKDLLESELFGHIKGSFTGALKDHWGKVKAAAGGTLFLDEIGDLPLDIQPKLLRLLQEREYERLGETITQTADVRVIAATNCDLKTRVAEGVFRQDLYFRLNVIAVEMPPLRTRSNDLVRFATHYLNYFAAEAGRHIRMAPGQSLKRLEAHSWPGNLRELRNAVERAVILAPTDEIGPDDLLQGLQSPVEIALTHQPGDMISLKKMEELHMRRVLDRTGSIVESAKVLEIDQATIYRRRKEWVKNTQLHLAELAC